MVKKHERVVVRAFPCEMGVQFPWNYWTKFDFSDIDNIFDNLTNQFFQYQWICDNLKTSDLLAFISISSMYRWPHYLVVDHVPAKGWAMILHPLTFIGKCQIAVIAQTLPEAQRTQGIESRPWIIFLTEINFKTILAENDYCASGNVIPLRILTMLKRSETGNKSWNLVNILKFIKNPEIWSKS